MFCEWEGVKNEKKEEKKKSTETGEQERENRGEKLTKWVSLW